MTPKLRKKICKQKLLINNTVTILLLLFVAAIFAPIASAGDWIPFEVFPSNDPQENPNIDGNIIVWQQKIEFNNAFD